MRDKSAPPVSPSVGHKTSPQEAPSAELVPLPVNGGDKDPRRSGGSGGDKHWFSCPYFLFLISYFYSKNTTTQYKIRKKTFGFFNFSNIFGCGATEPIIKKAAAMAFIFKYKYF